MPTAASSTEPGAGQTSRSGVVRQQVRQARRDLADVRTLVWFRSRGIKHPGRVRGALAVVVLLVLGAASLPALHPDAGASSGRAFELLLLLPTMMAGFLALAVVSAIASGGGRELLSREDGLAYPVSPTTDHLGALLLAPLNIAWILQSCLLLGVTAFAVGGHPVELAALQVFMLCWLVTATALAQVVAWTAEAIRRTRYGVWGLRLAALALGVVFVALQVNGRLGSVLDAVPTLRIFALAVAVAGGDWLSWAAAVAILVGVFLVAVVLGVWPAHVAARRLPRDEARAETHAHPARPMPRSDLAMLVRIDRASVWRTVPMRRGLGVLALGPGLVALAGGLPWSSVLVLPGLVASGGALLYGVNAWCLDERGALWRESLPVEEGAVFDARSWVLAEWLAVAALVTLLLGAVRAGVPTPAEFASALAVLVVVTGQVVSVAMTWSHRRPFSVNMRSARATPAPPSVMVGYSAKLATTTTLTGVCFTVTAAAGEVWQASALLAVPFGCWSWVRWNRARRVWLDPVERARVVTTVAA